MARFQKWKLILAIVLTPLALTIWKESIIYLIFLSQITWVDSAFATWRESVREEQEKNKGIARWKRS